MRDQQPAAARPPLLTRPGPPWRAVDRLVEQMEQLAKEVQEARDETRAEHAAAALALEQQKGAATVELEARSPTISP